MLKNFTTLIILSALALLSVPGTAIAATAASPKTDATQTHAQSVDCKNASTTNDLKFCAAQSYQEADKRLNEVYQKVIAGESSDQKNRLIDVQRTWIKFRDDSCALENPVSSDGREYPIWRDGCLEKVTQERTKDLESYLSWRTELSQNNQPSQPNSNAAIASLPDGNYRYTLAKFNSAIVSDDELLKAGGYYFVFRKQGQNITGMLAQVDSENTICVSGKVNGNTVTGRAVEVSEPPFNTKDTVRSTGEEFAAWDLMGGSLLKVRRGQKVGNKIIYSSALLDLKSLNRINAGSQAPPRNCP